MDQKSYLELAIEVVGSQTKLAEAIGGKVKTGHIYYWLQSGVVPAEHCPAIEGTTRAAGKTVLCEQLRPDIPWGLLRGHAVPEAA